MTEYKKTALVLGAGGFIEVTWLKDFVKKVIGYVV